MTDDREPVLAELPSGTAWAFGGFSYGLEPLTLPRPGHPAAVGDHPNPARYVEACRLLHRIGADGVSDDDVQRCTTLEELFWFRWITGHQVSFLVWRMTADVLDAVARGRVTRTAALRPLCAYVRGYCAMLLYTGSCPRSTYHAVIRPSMRLRHRGFSGSWAPDYRPIRYLLHGRHSPFAATPTGDELERAIRLHQLVHDGVAAKLVPDGRSLLRQSTVQRQDARLLGLIYDNYFMTLRAPVSRHELVAQLLRRVMSITQDLAANTLYPAPAEDGGQHVAELHAAEVRACEDSLTGILLEVASCAAGLPAGDVAERLPAATGGARSDHRPAASG